MSFDPLVLKTYKAPPVDMREILRYAACPEPTPETEELLRECLSDVLGKLSYRLVYRRFPLRVEEDCCDLGFMTVSSRSLAKHLEGCHAAIVFAATLGISIDREIVRASAASPAHALFYQAIGAERIEALCDEFNAQIEAEAAENRECTRPRFSPGYGDLPLSVQTPIFAALDCTRKLGLSLNASLLMSPSKSVTAIIGIGKKDKE